jgi:hypothetical protein
MLLRHSVHISSEASPKFYFHFLTMQRCDDTLLAIQCKQLLKQEQSMREM